MPNKLATLLAEAKARIGPEIRERLDKELTSARVDIRSKLVDEAWFSHREPARDTLDVPSGIHTPHIETGNALYEEVWGEEPEAEALYGEGPEPPDSAPGHDDHAPEPGGMEPGE